MASSIEGYALPSHAVLVLTSAASVAHASPITVQPLIVELEQPIGRTLIVEDTAGKIQFVMCAISRKGFTLAIDKVLAEHQQKGLALGWSLAGTDFGSCALRKDLHESTLVLGIVKASSGIQTFPPVGESAPAFPQDTIGEAVKRATACDELYLVGLVRIGCWRPHERLSDFGTLLSDLLRDPCTRKSPHGGRLW